METKIPKHQTIKTGYGKFELSIGEIKDRTTQEINEYTINLGSRETKCINLTIPTQYTNHRWGNLLFVKGKGICSIDKHIPDKFTQHMILLSFTIARNLNPNLLGVVLDDESGFMCTLPNGNSIQVAMKDFHLAFHESTWYEYYFDAKMIRDNTLYTELKLNFKNSEYKPPYFDFRNSELQDILQPLYESTNTWREFFDLIAQTFGSKKCAIVYPWLKSALYTIFDNQSIFESIKWYINFDENTKKNKTPHIHFISYSLQKGGRLHKTRRRSYTVVRDTPPLFIVPRSDVDELKYKDFV
jgi:hypothetical protein